MRWANDNELFDLIRNRLFTAVIGDIMDKLGMLNQFLPPAIQPLSLQMFVAGRAMTVLEEDMDAGEPGQKERIKDKPFGLMLEALDDVKENEVYLCTGSSPLYALWGELMSVRAMKLGAAGAIVDGYSRDTNGIRALGFPVFSYGRFAQDQAPRGRVVDFRSTVHIDGVRIQDGDIIVGDLDGVCVVPKQAEKEVIISALEKGREEKLVRKALEQGMSAREAFELYGIL
jgi:regulator of RNase E activity RraA